MKHKIFIVVISLLCAISAYPDYYNEVSVKGVSYVLDAYAKSAEVISRADDCYSGKVTIPSSITYEGTTYRVTSIGDYAFSSCSSLTDITIPNTITWIGDYAFAYCSSLIYVGIPRSVTRIGHSAFWGCSSLIYVAIPNSVTSIESYTFGGCSSLTSLTIPNSVTSIGKGAFYVCDELKVRTASSASLASSGIPSDRILQITQKEALADYEEAVSSEAAAYRKISEPANLTYVDGSVHFTDSTGNMAIDANETCHIRFQIRNDGRGEARNCKAKVALAGAQNDITVQNITVPTIAPQKSVDLDIPISANMQTKDGNATFTVEIIEPNGFGTDPMELTVATKAFVPPYLRIVDYSVTGSDGSTKLEKKRPFNLQLMLQNTQYGKAENIMVELKFPEGVDLIDGYARTKFASIEGGKAQPIDYEMVVKNSYTSNQIPVQVILKEKYGKYAENRTINLEINQMLSSPKLNIQAVEQNNRPEIQLATIGSDVDKNIPTTNISADSTFALIIANEDYQEVASVPYARNDGNIFRQYCIKTLGISEEHIRYAPNATLNQIKSQINWLANIAKEFKNSHIIVYYAGHGIPDEVSKTAYLLPVDGNGSDITTGYKLDDLYESLGSMPASQITVFMDACFSGSKREDGMLTSARGVALKAKSGVPQGNMVVFSAAQGDETAYPNRDEQHGLFTYYLLKKLQETQGDVDLKTLGDYITTNVSQQSLIVNSKKQTPCVIPSANVGTDWQNWKLW